METQPVHPCPRCGADVPQDSPLGLCPRCALADVATEAHGPGPGRAEDSELTLNRVAAAFPQFEVVEEIGRGGMGVVFKVRQPKLDRYVALKVLSDRLAQDPQFEERFHREARILARLNHPNIVAVHDFGEAGGLFYLVMEYIDGVNLRDAMRDGRFTPTEALKIIPGICEALQFAHEEGILHRDIKPENILLDGRGRVKIADFGIAKLVGSSAGEVTLTSVRAVLGTPQYMAPEQIERPKEVDHRADIYSLGVVFYELLTGELPIGRFAPPSKKVDLDARVDEIVLRALAKERELRQQSAAEVGTEVESVRRTPGPSDARVSGAVGAVPGGRAWGQSRAFQEDRDKDGLAGEPGPDFLVCHPALPRMAQAITVYTLVVAPVLWLLSLATVTSGSYESPYARFADFLTQATSIVGSLILVGMGGVGGWRLRSLAPSGPRLIRLSLWLDLVLGGVVLAGTIWVERLEAVWRARAAVGPQTETVTLSGLEIVVALLSFGALAFQILALIWLIRRREWLAARLALAAPGVEASADLELARSRSDSVRGATVAAVLTVLSVILGLALAGGTAMYGVGLGQGAGWGGLGPVEVALVLLVTGGIVAAGVAGCVMGARGLRQAREARALMNGVGRAALGALGWPMVLLEMALVLGMGLPLWAILPGWLAIVLTLSAGVATGEWALRQVWRWLRAVPHEQAAGGRPGWVHGLVLLAVGAAWATVLPAASVGFSNYLRSRIPPMVVELRPDPAWVVDSNFDRSAMQMGVTFPGRSIVWMRTTLVRGDQVLRSPLSTFHVVTGGFDAVTGSVFVRLVASQAVDGPQWEMAVAADTAIQTFTHASEETVKVHWRPVGPEGQQQVHPGRVYEGDLLRGRDANGIEWKVVLVCEVDPLPPAFLFDGVRLGTGTDWQATAAAGAGEEAGPLSVESP